MLAVIIVVSLLALLVLTEPSDDEVNKRDR
jgi:hypothetical protein